MLHLWFQMVQTLGYLITIALPQIIILKKYGNDMIETLLRINIPYVSTPQWLPHKMGVYRATLTKIAAYDSYYSSWTQGTYNTELLIIGAVSVNLDGYAKKGSLTDCEDDDRSFYWDTANQTLYIHFEFDKIPETTSIVISNQGGYSFIGTSESIYIDNVEFKPRIMSLPSIKKKVDAFQVGKMTFQDQSITLKNGDGALDDFITEPIPGAEGSIVLYDTSDLSELEYYTGFITADKNTIDTLDIKLQDKRRRENIKVPSTRFDATTYTDIESKYVGKIIPEGYGVNIGIPCTPVNGEVTSGNIQFRYATDGTVLTEIRIKVDDVWTVKSGSNKDPATGYFELSYANATNASGAVYECVCDATLRAEVNPGDIIADMNSRYNSIEYDASSYDLTEWASEAAKLADVALYLDKEQEFFKWIEKLQNGSDLFFVYDILGDGTKTLRVNDPNRASARTINPQDIKNYTRPVERDFSEFSSTVTVLYSHDWQEDTDERIEVDTYEETVLAKYLFPQDSEFESLLVSETDAQTKADVIAEDQQEARPVATVVLHESTLTKLNLKLYDIISVDLSTPATTYWSEQLDSITALSTATDSITALSTATDSITAIIGQVLVDPGAPPSREYWGTIRGQLIGIGYNPTDLSYTLTIRERPESEVI